jgi:hypothetical protein
MWGTDDTERLPDRGRGRPSWSRPHRPSELLERSRWETCEIHDAEGIRGDHYKVRCHWFQALASGPYGTYTAGTSEGFYCPNWAPEPEYAAGQLAALAGVLKRAGWQPLDSRGSEWWSLRFRRRVRADR